MADFFLNVVENAVRTPVAKSTEVGGYEIYAQVDATPLETAPSVVKHCEVSLPAGLYCEDLFVRLEGSTAARWELTTDDPTDPDVEPQWVSELTNGLVDYRPTPPVPFVFWMRATTYNEEPATNDRLAPVAVTGRQRAGA